jgi:hypothetical protein
MAITFPKIEIIVLLAIGDIANYNRIVDPKDKNKNHNNNNPTSFHRKAHEN